MRTKGKRKRKKIESTGVKTSEREKIAVWLDNAQLSILREWRDHEALNIGAFIRNAITEAINKKEDRK